MCTRTRCTCASLSGQVKNTESDAIHRHDARSNSRTEFAKKSIEGANAPTHEKHAAVSFAIYCCHIALTPIPQIRRGSDVPPYKITSNLGTAISPRDTRPTSHTGFLHNLPDKSEVSCISSVSPPD